MQNSERSLRFGLLASVLTNCCEGFQQSKPEASARICKT